MSLEPACPCLCGCPAHVGTYCGSCGCTRYAPDYVAGATARGDVMSPAFVAQLKAAQEDVARQVGHQGRPKRNQPDGRPIRKCRYCRGSFRVSVRADGTLYAGLYCCGACRQAWSAALAYADDADVPVASVRHSAFSRERANATGFGFVNQSEALRNDLRARRWVRIFGRQEVAA